MKRKLSTVEYMIEGNLTCLVSVDGHLSMNRLRSALERVQRKHPALRALIRQQSDGLYYEADTAGPIPLRSVEIESEEHGARERQAELTTAFAHHQPQLRVAWLRSGASNELLFTASHRICDGMSMLILVREVLKSLHRDDALHPNAPLTLHDIIGDARDEDISRRRRSARILNAVIALIPGSRRPVDNEELYREWSASLGLSTLLKQRCKLEKVSMHAALLTALDIALQATFGKQAPAWIESPFDGRRDKRIPQIKSDMLFFSGGSFRIRAGQGDARDFWERARAMHKQVRLNIEQELIDIPGKYQFFEMIRTPSENKMRSIVRLHNFMRGRGHRRVFSFSNFGDIRVLEEDAPFELKDFRLFVHSFVVRLLGIFAYSLHGQLRFVYFGDEKCLSCAEVDALRGHFMAVLETCVEHRAEAPERLGTLEVVVE
jgi:hypothetical protein